jgi:hypothetical protein
VADGLSLESVTKVPPIGAGPFKVTVPVDELPPLTVAGFIDSEAKAGGLMAREVACVPL